VNGSDIVVLRDALLGRAHTDSERLAYAHAGAKLSFAELAERASVRGAALQRLGVGHGDRVVLAMSAGLPFVEVFWALQLIGAVSCAVNPSVPGRTLARRIERVRPALVVTDDSAAEMASARPEVDLSEIEPADLSHLQFTSGTSGEPRIAMLAQRNVIGYLRGTAEDSHFLADDVLVTWMPPWHDFGLVEFIMSAVYHGVGCHLLEPTIWNIPEWLATIARVGGTVIGGPDTACRLASRMVDPKHVNLASLRVAWNGAEPVRWSTIEQFEARFSCPGVVAPGYGLAESTVGVTVRLPGEERVVDERGNVSCGRPMPGFEVKAGSNHDQPEEIRIRGEAVFCGYLDEPEETARALQDGWLHSGDVGYLDSAGRLFVLGRRSGMIKRAGGVIAPRELEEAAEEVKSVRVAAATTIPATTNLGGQDGERIVVVVETKSRNASADLISAEVSRRIIAAVGFAPGRVYVLPPKTIPRTENGKVRHALLRAALPGDALG
jgi:acyl-CoA synthetase (AMP-forming)/AMP-acid ligase II